jgi:5'-nucleotidase
VRVTLRRGALIIAAALILAGGGTAAALILPAGAAQALGCTQTVTGTYDNAITVGSGQVLCLDPGAEVTGTVEVQSGGALVDAAATIDGSLTGDSGAGAITACGATIDGAVAITGASGLVTFGTLLQIIPLLPTCSGSTIGGSATFTSSTGGVTLAGNQIGGSFACSGNSPAPADDLIANSAAGTASGQCAAPF